MRAYVTDESVEEARKAIREGRFNVYKSILARNKGRIGLGKLRDLSPNRDHLKRPRGWARAAVFDAFREDGLEILDIGAPDYWIRAEGGDPVPVIVKTFPSQKPRKQVQRVLDIYAKNGISCLIWDPETGFNIYRAKDGGKYHNAGELLGLLKGETE